MTGAVGLLASAVETDQLGGVGVQVAKEHVADSIGVTSHEVTGIRIERHNGAVTIRCRAVARVIGGGAEEPRAGQLHRLHARQPAGRHNAHESDHAAAKAYAGNADWQSNTACTTCKPAHENPWTTRTHTCLLLHYASSRRRLIRP